LDNLFFVTILSLVFILLMTIGRVISAEYYS
jgi:hypothetical protein